MLCAALRTMVSCAWTIEARRRAKVAVRNMVSMRAAGDMMEGDRTVVAHDDDEEVMEEREEFGDAYLI